MEKFPDVVQVKQDGTTVYVGYPKKEEKPSLDLYKQYRSDLKKQKFRIVPANIRLVVLKDVIRLLGNHSDLHWRQSIDMLSAVYQKQAQNISKNMINDVLLVAREGQVIRTLKGKSLATAPIQLQLEGDNMFQEAVIRCDASYLTGILELDAPFDIEEAAMALYDSPKYVNYLQWL